MVWMSERSGTQEALLVGIENGDEDTSGISRPLRSRLMPTRTSNCRAQVTDDLHPLDGIDVGMEVTHPDPVVRQKIGQSSAIRLVSTVSPEPARAADALLIPQEVIDLRRGRTVSTTIRVHQAGGLTTCSTTWPAWRFS